MEAAATIERKEVEVVKRREKGRQDLKSELVWNVDMKRRQSSEREYETVRSMGVGAGDGGVEGGVEGGSGRFVRAVGIGETGIVDVPGVSSEAEEETSDADVAAGAIDTITPLGWVISTSACRLTSLRC